MTDTDAAAFETANGESIAVFYNLTCTAQDPTYRVPSVYELMSMFAVLSDK